MECSELAKLQKDIVDNFKFDTGELSKEDKEKKRFIEPMIIKKLEESLKHLQNTFKKKVSRRLEKIHQNLEDQQFKEIL